MKRLLGVCTFCVTLYAQQQQDPFVIRSTTKLVQINVIALDKKGHPVDDLKPSEVEISEQGKPQKLAIFSRVQNGALLDQPFAPKPNVFSNRLIKSGMPSTVTVILLDGLNTEFADQARSRAHVLKYLSTIRAEDRVALYALGRNLRVLHDFTTDTSELIARVKSYRGENSGELAASVIPDLQSAANASQQDPLAAFNADDPGAPTLREAEFTTSSRVLNTLKAMEAIGAHLTGLPGRKSLIWVSGTFPLSMGFDQDYDASNMMIPVPERRTFFEEMNRTVRLLNHAGVAVYPVDARGLMVDPGFAASKRSGPDAKARPFTTPNIDTMVEMASRTGGRAFYNRNDIGDSIRTAAEDGRLTYTLGYYPANEPDDHYHEIKVKVTRPGVTVRYRRGYFAYKQVKTTDVAVKGDIARAMWSPLDATGVAINARVDLNEKTDEFEIVVQVDPATLSIEQKAGRWTGRVDLGFTQKDGQGSTYGSLSDTISLNLTNETYAKLQQGGLLFQRVLARNAKAKVLRIVARDAGSGLTGSISVPFKQVTPYTPKDTPTPAISAPPR